MSLENLLPDDARTLLRSLKNQNESYWMERGDAQALSLFLDMARRVPAYKDFLKKNAVDPEKIKNIHDFKQVPLTSKDNYLLEYPLASLCWDGDLKKGQWVIASTSGSTGQPYYFPRTHHQDKQFKLTAEVMFLDFFEIDKKTTLFIDCFALGVWIGGMFMYQAVKSIIDSGQYPLSIITPGADKTEAIKAVKNLAGQFDQIIIGGYAPLVKDLIDDGIQAGISWNAYGMRYFFAAEGFTEGYRDYILKRGGAKNVFTSTINHYGTADLGTMANETPLSILLRRQAAANEKLSMELFSDPHRQPTLTQYIPELFYFEDIDHRLACSAQGGLPLVRYDLKDRGGIKSLATMIALSKKQGIEIVAEAKQQRIDTLTWNLPFVYVFERDDLTVSIYSVNIYPESIRKALQKTELEDCLTGKFTMVVNYNEKQNQFLQINIELKNGKNASAEFYRMTVNAIITSLNKENSEWRDFYADEGIRNKIIPELVFWPYQDALHFRPGGKQKWTKKRIINP